MKVFRPLDFLVLIIVLGTSFFCFKISAGNKGDVVTVQAENSSYQFKLDKDAVYDIPGPLGITKIEIKDNKVHIIDSPCSGKTCISQGWSSPIVCLPNNVIITVENYGEFDAVAE